MKLLGECGRRALVTGPNLLSDQAFCFTQVRRKILNLIFSVSFENSGTELTTCGTPQPNIIHGYNFISRSFVWRGKLWKGTWIRNMWKNIIASFFKSGFPLLIRESSVRKVGICRLSLWAHSSSSTHAAYSEYLIFVSVIAKTSRVTVQENQS